MEFIIKSHYPME